MKLLSQFEVEVELVPLSPFEMEERSLRLRVLMMRGALRDVAQQTVEIANQDLRDPEPTELTVTVGDEDE
jgi:hypothetical protein